MAEPILCSLLLVLGAILCRLFYIKGFKHGSFEGSKTQYIKDSVVMNDILNRLGVESQSKTPD